VLEVPKVVTGRFRSVGIRGDAKNMEASMFNNRIVITVVITVHNCVSSEVSQAAQLRENLGMLVWIPSSFLNQTQCKSISHKHGGAVYPVFTVCLPCLQCVYSVFTLFKVCLTVCLHYVYSAFTLRLECLYTVFTLFTMSYSVFYTVFTMRLHCLQCVSTVSTVCLQCLTLCLHSV